MKGPVNIKLAQRLLQLRKHSKWSQAMLADAVGITKQAISDYENAKSHIPSERAEQMMRVMGYELRHLHEEPGTPPPPIRFRAAPKVPGLLTARLYRLHGFCEGSNPLGQIIGAPATNFDALLEIENIGGG